MKSIRARVTYANVMSTLAVFLVLGGTAFALARNSVGTKQLKRSSVTAAKIRKSAVKRSKIASDAVNGSKVESGSLTGADIDSETLPFPNPPQSGTVLRGTFSMRDVAAAPGEEIQEGISFGFTLSTAPTVNYVNSGAAVPPGCTGGTPENPLAAPGNLCIYEGAAPLNSTDRGEFDPATLGSPDNVAQPYGFAVFARSAAAGAYRSRGSWAVTAP